MNELLKLRVPPRVPANGIFKYPRLNSELPVVKNGEPAGLMANGAAEYAGAIPNGYGVIIGAGVAKPNGRGATIAPKGLKPDIP